MKVAVLDYTHRENALVAIRPQPRRRAILRQVMPTLRAEYVCDLHAAMAGSTYRSHLKLALWAEVKCRRDGG